jgi:hypothetical protein
MDATDGPALARVGQKGDWLKDVCEFIVKWTAKQQIRYPDLALLAQDQPDPRYQHDHFEALKGYRLP